MYLKKVKLMIYLVFHFQIIVRVVMPLIIIEMSHNIHLVHILFAKIFTPQCHGALLLLLLGRLIVISYPCTPLLAIYATLPVETCLSPYSYSCFPTGNISYFPFLFGANFAFTHCSLFSWHLSCFISIDSGVSLQNAPKDPWTSHATCHADFALRANFAFRKCHYFLQEITLIAQRYD